MQGVDTIEWGKWASFFTDIERLDSPAPILFRNRLAGRLVHEIATAKLGERSRLMQKPLLLAGLISFALSMPAAADSLNVLVFPLSGEVRLQNPSGTAVPFIFYSITSSTNQVGALNPNNPPWRSISDYYDASGNGFIDPVNQWVKLSDKSIELAEAVIGNTSSLPAFRTLSLGTVWNTGVVPYTNLAFEIRQETQAVTTNVQVAVEGDYNHNGVVDQADYTVWRQNIGSTTSLDADGNLNGVVDAGDFVYWRKNFGNSWPGAGSSGGGLSLEVGGYAVPEPSTIGLVGLATCAILPRRRRLAA